MSCRNYGPQRLKKAVLDYIDRRIEMCQAEEDRQTEKGNNLGAATERSAKLEADLIRRFIAELPVAGEPASLKG